MKIALKAAFFLVYRSAEIYLKNFIEEFFYEIRARVWSAEVRKLQIHHVIYRAARPHVISHRYIGISHRSSLHTTNEKARKTRPANYRAAPQLIQQHFILAFL